MKIKITFDKFFIHNDAMYMRIQSYAVKKKLKELCPNSKFKRRAVTYVKPDVAIVRFDIINEKLIAAIEKQNGKTYT